MGINAPTKKNERRKNTVSLEILQEIKEYLLSLSENTNRQFDAKAATTFLREGIEWAVEKNYSFEEITEMIRARGWAIPSNSIKYFWNVFKTDDKRTAKTKKKKSDSAVKNIRRETVATDTNSTHDEVVISEIDSMTSIAAKNTDTVSSVAEQNSDVVTAETADKHKKQEVFPPAKENSSVENKKSHGEKTEETAKEVSTTHANTGRKAHFSLEPDSDDL